MGEEAEYAFTVVGRYHYDSPTGQCKALIAGLTATTRHQTATIKIKKYGQVLVHLPGRRPNVEVQTVLAVDRRAENHVAINIELNGIGTEILGLTHALPSLKGLRCLRSEEHTSELQSRQYLVCR